MDILHSVVDFTGNILVTGNLNCSIALVDTYDFFTFRWCQEPEFPVCRVKTEFMDVDIHNVCNAFSKCSDTGNNLEFCSDKDVKNIVFIIVVCCLPFVMSCCICWQIYSDSMVNSMTRSSPTSDHYAMSRYDRRGISSPWFEDSEDCSILTDECSVCLEMGDGKKLSKCKQCSKLFHEDCIKVLSVCPLCRNGGNEMWRMRARDIELRNMVVAAIGSQARTRVATERRSELESGVTIDVESGDDS